MRVLVTEAVNIIRQRVNDLDKINYSDDEILNDIKSACKYLSLALISRKAPEMLDTETVVDYTAVPVLFHSLAGQYPVWREGQLFRTSTGQEAIEIRYWRMREAVKTLNDYLPFDENYLDCIIMTTCTILLNRDEFDITNEKTMVATILELLPSNIQVAATTSTTGQ